MSHKNFGPDRFSRFDVYWIQTNRQTDKQTDRQAKFIYRCERKDCFVILQNVVRCDHVLVIFLQDEE